MAAKTAIAGNLLVVAVGVTAAQEVDAAVTTGTLSVTLEIQGACTLSGTSPIAFGTQRVLSANTDATGSLAVQCTDSTPYAVSLDAGAGAGATTGLRKMTSGATTVDYALYRDSSRTLAWGNTQGTDTVAGTGNGGNQTLTVYGRVPSQASPAPGSYADTVNVTVTY